MRFLTNIFKGKFSEPPDKFKIIFLNAARNGDQRTMQKMLKKYPVVIHARATESITALHYTSYLGHYNLVQILLDAEADIHAVVTNGWTPLHFAASEGEVKILGLLLEYGSNINARDARGITPLGVAIATQRNNSEEFLLKKGAGMGGEDLLFLEDGINLINRNDPKRGIIALKEALRINPILAEAHKVLAIHYMGIQEKTEAQKHYETLKNLDQKLTQELLDTPLGNLFQKNIKHAY